MEPQRNKLIQNISHEYQASFASLQYDQRKSRPLKGKSKQKLISYTVRTILQEKTNALNVRGSDQTRNKSINHVAHKRGKEKKKKGKMLAASQTQLHGSSQPFGISLLMKSIMAWTASSTLLDKEWLPSSISAFSAPPSALHSLSTSAFLST